MTSNLFGWGFVSGIAFSLVIAVQHAPQSDKPTGVMERAAVTAGFDYFPAQYVNQGSDTGEHIATF